MSNRLIKIALIMASLCAAAPLAMANGSHCCASSPSHNINISAKHGVTIYRPTALLDARAARAQALAEAKISARAREVATRRAIDAQNTAALEARLARIEATQNQILEAQSQRRTPRTRRVFLGNPRFFGPNGFIGNSNFSGATVPTRTVKRKARRAAQ